AAPVAPQATRPIQARPPAAAPIRRGPTAVPPPQALPPPPAPAPRLESAASLPRVEKRVAEIEARIGGLKALMEQEPATARTREWHCGILEKRRDLLLEGQKRDQQVVAQLTAFPDVFEVILGRVSASQFSASEVATYMGNVVTEIEETEKFVEALRPAMDELL